MRTVNVMLEAGKEKKVSVTGKFLTLLSAAAAVDIAVEMIGKAGNADVMTGIPEGYAEQFVEMFNAVTLTSETDQVIQLGYAMGTVRIDRSTIVTRQATELSDGLSTFAVVGRALVLAADSTRMTVTFTADPDNAGKIYLGGPGVDDATGSIILEAGDSWIEDRAAAAAWYGYADTAGDKIRRLVSL